MTCACARNASTRVSGSQHDSAGESAASAEAHEVASWYDSSATRRARRVSRAAAVAAAAAAGDASGGATTRSDEFASVRRIRSSPNPGKRRDAMSSTSAAASGPCSREACRASCASAVAVSAAAAETDATSRRAAADASSTGVSFRAKSAHLDASRRRCLSAHRRAGSATPCASHTAAANAEAEPASCATEAEVATSPRASALSPRGGG